MLRFRDWLLGVMVLFVLLPMAGAGERRYPGKWKWVSHQEREIAALKKKAAKSGEYWAISKGPIQVRCSVSAELAAEAGVHASAVLAVMGDALQLPPFPESAKGARFVVSIHGTSDQFDEATDGADEDLGFSKVTAGGDGPVSEIHLLSDWDVHPGYNNNLVECIDVGLLQRHVARSSMRLLGPDRPLPKAVREGCEAFFETYNVGKKNGTDPGMNHSGVSKPLRDALLRREGYRPRLFDLLRMSDKVFDADAGLNAELAGQFANFMLTNESRRKVFRQLLKLAVAEGDLDTIEVRKAVAAKEAAKLEAEWEKGLVGSVALSRPIRFADLSVKAKPPGAASVNKLGRYGNNPLVSVMPAEGGAFDVAWYSSGTKSIHVMQCDAENRKIGELAPSFLSGDVRKLLGAARLPNGEGYVVGYSKDNAHGNKGFEYWVARFSANETEEFNVRIFGDKSSAEMKSKGGPGGAGTGRVVYNPKTKRIAFYLAHNQLWPDKVRHQGGYVGFLDERGKRLSGGNGWFFSHNFDQRLIVADGDFYALAHGDAYPRALGFSRWSGTNGKKLADKRYHEIPGESGDNTTNCQTGGVAALGGGRFGVLFASANGRKGHDVCIKLMSDTGDTLKERWLTEHDEGKFGAFPRIARYGKHFLCAWEEPSGGGLQLEVLDSKLETVMPRITAEGLHLSPYDDLHTLEDGAVVWAVPNGGKIRVCRIDLPTVLEPWLTKRLAGVKRVPQKAMLERMDKAMAQKLAKLDGAGKLPKEALKLSVSATKLRLKGAKASGGLVLEAVEGGKEAEFVYGDLPLRDRAVVALSMLEGEPENRTLYGVGGFYYDCGGSDALAQACYDRSGREVASRFAGYFDQVAGDEL